ncbi:MAG: cytochrome c oxidase subunit 3, partial [Acetobacteraceae bacterium]|nr:cytochrome c oxidase subunit 3 [Acetobacteraceae bacterium]
AISGMWLFLATELLFFGALFLTWVYSRHFNTAGFDEGAKHTDLLIGSVNTAILITSSFVYYTGLNFIEKGGVRGLIVCCIITLLLGLAFMVLKFGIEWRDDFDKHMFPGPDFAITGPNRGGAMLFYVFYFISTMLHGAHLLVGIALVTWILVRAWRGVYDRMHYTGVEVVGIYWSFVDVIWLVLYPLIYLVGR